MGATSKFALPYPEPTDLAMEGTEQIQALAEAVDERLPGRRGRVYRVSSSWAIISGSNEDLQLGTHDAAWSTSEFTHSGGDLLYTGPDIVVACYAFVEWEANGSGYRRIIIERNGANEIQTQVDPDATGVTRHSVSGLLSIVSGDLLGVEVRQNSGATLNIADGELRVVMIGAV